MNYESLRGAKTSGLGRRGSGAAGRVRGRLVKYVPADIVAIYTSAVGGIISSKPGDTIEPWIALGLIVLFVAGTFAYFWFKSPTGVVRSAHLAASPVAFLALAYPLAAPLLHGWFIGWLAIVGQAIAALLAWLVAPEEKPAGNQQG